MIDTF